MTSSPSFVGTPKSWEASVGNGGTAGQWYFMGDNTFAGAGASGSKITSITAINTDSTARAIQVAVLRGIAQTGGTGVGVASANVSMTFASPGVFTVSTSAIRGTYTHTFIQGDQLVAVGTFNASANVVQGNTLFVVAGGLSATQFEVAYTQGGTALNTGSGTYTGMIVYGVRMLGAVTVPTSGGTDGANAGVNILSNSLLPGIPVDNDGNPYIFLESTDYLAFSPIALPAANKIITVSAFGGNF